MFLFLRQRYFRLALLITFLGFSFSIGAQAQVFDSAATGYLLDAAEEYWPLIKDSSGTKNLISTLKHRPINQSKGYAGIGLHGRETYEYFKGYFWGMGSQDKNGYFLHRVLAHADVRWNQHVRAFTEVQSSTITGRNGGPRPVQDLNKLGINQIFGEFSVTPSPGTRLSLRLGKQALQYGIGSLLDIRDANVRRTFTGVKAILENRKFRLDAFYMKLVRTKPGLFDDQLDNTQAIGGLFMTHQYATKLINKLDLYFLVINRSQTRFNQGIGNETRYTTGTGFNVRIGNWSGYSEADLQWGSFNHRTILAWKGAQSIIYQFAGFKGKPILSVQAAVSSGDNQVTDTHLQTFNPLYPKAIYYGYIDNVGSANMMLIHPKGDIQLHPHLKFTGGYYQFWRQSLQDGIYAANGAFLLPSDNQERRVGSMYDVAVNYCPNTHLSVQFICSYYKRGAYLQNQPLTPSNIHYAGLRTTLRL